MGIGPQLPSQPDSVKRKRDTTECDENVASLAEIAHATAPSLHEKRQRVFGPALPPAPLDQRPEADTEVPSWGGSDDGDEDDDFGPSLPGAADAAADHASTSTWNDSSEGQAQSTAVKPKREDWMLAPPPGDDWTSRIDPTKLKSRKFNSGRGAAAQSSRNPNDSSSWTETPEEKKRRLENEVMGVSAPTHADKPSKMTAREESEAKATDRKIREYNASIRGPSLYSDHQKSNPKEKEDDPSKRAFDREKDIAGAPKISHTKMREMRDRAADFGSRFAKGSYL